MHVSDMKLNSAITLYKYIIKKCVYILATRIRVYPDTKRYIRYRIRVDPTTLKADL